MAITFTVFKGSPDGTIKEDNTTLPELSSNEVLLEHSHSGVCGTDAHYLCADMVLGHEGVGSVKATGENVTLVKAGDRVGFGYVKGGCGRCQFCVTGYTFHCTEQLKAFSVSDFDQGSFATHSVWPATRLVKIPLGIKSEDAAPFMCAGQTVFVPMLRNRIKPSDHVGIVGIGGLGHLAIQFAAAWGCRVSVFSSSDSKKKEALGFGATNFYVTKGLQATNLPEKLDHLIVTSSVKPEWDLYAGLMAPFGHIYPLTIAEGKLEFPYLPLIVKELSIHGSCSSSLEEIEKMLQFIVDHKIKPKIEKFPLSAKGITEAFQKLEDGSIRYRGVLEV